LCYQVEVISAVILANLIHGGRDVAELAAKLLHGQEDVAVGASAGGWGRGVVATNDLTLTHPTSTKGGQNNEICHPGEGNI